MLLFLFWSPWPNKLLFSPSSSTMKVHLKHKQTLAINRISNLLSMDLQAQILMATATFLVLVELSKLCFCLLSCTSVDYLCRTQAISKRPFVLYNCGVCCHHMDFAGFVFVPLAALAWFLVIDAQLYSQFSLQWSQLFLFNVILSPVAVECFMLVHVSIVCIWRGTCRYFQQLSIVLFASQVLF